MQERVFGQQCASPLGRGPGELPFVWAHRGASALAPENTLRAFTLADQLGAQGVELDVQLSADGVPVVLHDPFLWSDGDALSLHPEQIGGREPRRVPIATSTWADLRAVQVHFPDGSSENLPRLEEVLEVLPERLWVDIELKAGAVYDPRLAGVVVGCLKNRPDRVMVSSFDHIALREVATAGAQVVLSALCDARVVDPRLVVSAIPAPMISLRRAFLYGPDVGAWRALGVEVSVYGAEILTDLAEVVSWPVSAIFLDDPRLGLALSRQANGAELP